MMQNNLGRIFKRAVGKRYFGHRDVDQTIRALGVTNKNIVRNPT